ncbi:MAG: GH3 auxin-responsive promoter family protein [Cyanobacteria bacterium P01_A01_bin.17]
MANFALTVLGLVTQWSKKNFTRKTHNIVEVQTAFLRSLLQAHQNTEFGREYSFSTIQTVEQFRQRVPIQPYSSFEPYIQRMADGETNVLTAEPPIYFNITSGSTGRKKLIPVTKRSRQVLSKINRVAIGFVTAAAKREQAPLGKILFPGSTNALGKTKGGIPYAPVSTSDLRLGEFLYRQIAAYPADVFKISDIATRHYVCLLFSLRDPGVRIICATFPALALLMCDYLDQYSDSLIHDLETGQLADHLQLDPTLRIELEKVWSAVPERAAQLRQIFETYGRLTPQHAWPHLSFLVTARGGTSNFYFQRFSEYFGNINIYGGVYSSAEATYGVHRDFNTDGVILAIESGFYEFIPEDQWDVEQPHTLLPWEVEVGRRYRIVFSNYSGFYRYDLGDVVEVEGFYEQTPLLIFRYRRGGVMTSVGEKITEFHALQVMQKLQRDFDLRLENFCFTLTYDAPAQYLINIELAAGQQLTDPVAFLGAFDATLKELHTMYALKRRDQVQPPHLRILAPGSFEQVRQRMIQNGAVASQLKMPHVTEDREFLAGITVTQEIHGSRLEPVQASESRR